MAIIYEEHFREAATRYFDLHAAFTDAAFTAREQGGSLTFEDGHWMSEYIVKLAADPMTYSTEAFDAVLKRLRGEDEG